MGGALMSVGILILNGLLAGDGIGLRLAGLALMGLMLFVVRFEWLKGTFKFELSEIVMKLGVGKSELFGFLQLVMSAGSKYLSQAFAKDMRLRVGYVRATVSTTIKTVFATNSEAKARLKSALRAVAIALTPKLLQSPAAACA